MNGAFIMFISTVFYSFMALLAKMATGSLHGSVVVFYRFLMTFLFISFLILVKRVKIRIVNRKALILRGIFGGIAMTLYFVSFSYIPLGRAVLLTYTFPISATILSHFMLKERIGKNTLFALVIAIIGLIVVTGVDIGEFFTGDILGIIGGIAAGFAIVYIKQARKTDNSWIILYSLGIFGTLLVSPVAASNFKMPSFGLFLLLCLMAFFSIAGQITMTYAYKFCTASKGSTISLTTVVLSNLWGVVFLGETLTVNFILGGLLILASIYYIMRQKLIIPED